MDFGSPVALVLIGSFAVDRIVSGLLFLLSLRKSWEGVFPDPDLVQDPVAKAVAAKQRKLVYFLLAAAFSIPVVIAGGITIFPKLGFRAVPPLLDELFTSLIFVGGADRIAGLLKKHDDKVTPGAINVEGSISLVSEEEKRASKCPSCAASVESGGAYCGHCGTPLKNAA